MAIAKYARSEPDNPFRRLRVWSTVKTSIFRSSSLGLGMRATGLSVKMPCLTHQLKKTDNSRRRLRNVGLDQLGLRSHIKMASVVQSPIIGSCKSFPRRNRV